MAKKELKTNVMRLLEHSGVAYTALYYDLAPEDFSGQAVSAALGIEPERCFKTLCARGQKGRVLLFVIPVNAELALRKAAAVCGEKKLELAAVRELRALTGYERGSVCPIGTKKRFPVYIDESAQLFETIELSGGAAGASVELSPQALAAYTEAAFADLTE